MTNTVYFLIVSTLFLFSYGEMQNQNVRPNAFYWTSKDDFVLALYSDLSEQMNAPSLYMKFTTERLNQRNMRFHSSYIYHFDFVSNVSNCTDTFPVPIHMFSTKSYKFRFDLHVRKNESRIASFEVNISGSVGNGKIYMLDDVYGHYKLFVKLITGLTTKSPKPIQTSPVAYNIQKWLTQASSQENVCGIIFNQTSKFFLRFGPLMNLSKNISGSIIISLDFKISNADTKLDIMRRHYRYSGWMYPCPVSTNNIPDEYHIAYPDSWKNSEVAITLNDVYTNLEMKVIYALKNGSSILNSSETTPFLANLFFTPQSRVKIDGDNKHVAAFVGDYSVKLFKCGPEGNVAYLWQTYIGDRLYDEVFYHNELDANGLISARKKADWLAHPYCRWFGEYVDESQHIENMY